MNSEGEDISVGGSSPRASNRVPRCSLCRNHGLVVDLKNHKRYCNWKNCTCVACLGTMQKRKVNANQVAARRAAKQDSELGEPAKQDSELGEPAKQDSELGSSVLTDCHTITICTAVVPPTQYPAPPLPPNHTVYSTFERVKEEISFLQTQYQSLKLDCDKLTAEKADMQRHYVTYYEMSYGLNMEMHKQTEIAKRLNTIIAQILPYLSTEQHQQQVVAAVERAKQVSMNELNGFNGLNDSSRHTLSRDAAFLPSVVHPTNFARSPSGLGVSVPSTPGELCTSPRIGNSPVVLVAGHEGLQPLIRITPEIPMQNASMASGISNNHLSDPVASSQRDHERDRKKPREAFCSARSPVIVECRSLTALQSHKEVQAWLAQPVTNDKLGKADFEDSDGYRSDQESVVDVVNEDPGSPLVVAAIRTGIGYGDKHDEVPRHQLSLLAHSEFRQLSGERFLQERHVSVAARM